MISTGPIGYLLLITGALGTLLAMGLLVKRRPSSYYFFSGTLLIISFSAILLAAVKFEWLLKFPHLFLVGSPLQYLIGPGCYYFALFSINPYHKFRKPELLHLVPFLMNLFELTPFYLLSSEEKLSIIKEAYRTMESVLVLPKQVFVLNYFQALFLKSSSIFIYSLMGFMLVWRNYRKSMASYRAHNILIFNWVIIETTLKMTLGVAAMIKSLWNLDFPQVDVFFSVIMSLDTIIGFGFILLNPRILEGAHPVKSEFPPLFGEPSVEEIIERAEGNSLAELTEPGSVTPVSKHFQFIESYFQTQKPFLKEDFSKETMVIQTRLNKKVISEQIKIATGMNFSDYVNSYRLRYLEENASARPEWRKYTVDALGAEIGFFNRGSFYNAVKRHRNITAGQLLKNLGLGDRD